MYLSCYGRIVGAIDNSLLFCYNQIGKFWKAHSFSIESYQYFRKLYDEMRYYKRVSDYYIYDYMMVPVK